VRRRVVGELWQQSGCRLMALESGDRHLVAVPGKMRRSESDNDRSPEMRCGVPGLCYLGRPHGWFQLEQLSYHTADLGAFPALPVCERLRPGAVRSALRHRGRSQLCRLTRLQVGGTDRTRIPRASPFDHRPVSSVRPHRLYDSRVIGETNRTDVDAKRGQADMDGSDAWDGRGYEGRVRRKVGTGAPNFGAPLD